MTPSRACAEKVLKVHLDLWTGLVWLKNGKMGSWKEWNGQPHGFLKFRKGIHEVDFSNKGYNMF